MHPSNRRKGVWPYVLLAVILILAGAFLLRPAIPREPDRALDSASEIEFYSLDGKYFEKEWKEGELESFETFHSWPVLGKTTITDSQTRTELVDAFRTGVNDRSAVWAKCFWPRHGMRVVRDGVTYDLVICFECTQYEWYKDDEKQDPRLIGNAPQPTFNRILEQAGVPLAEPPTE